MFYLNLELNHNEVKVNMDEALYFTPDSENVGSIIYMPRQHTALAIDWRGRLRPPLHYVYQQEKSVQKAGATWEQG